MHVDSTCIPLPGSCLVLESSFSQKAQKCFLDLIVVMIAFSAGQGVFILSSIMVPLSIRD